MRYLRSSDAIRTFAWSSDSCFIAAITSRGDLNVWSRDEAWPIATGEVNVLCYRVAFADADRTVLIWDNRVNQAWGFDPTAVRPSTLHRASIRDSFPERMGVGWGAGEYDCDSDAFYARNHSAILQFSRRDGTLSEYPLYQSGRILTCSGYSSARRIAATVDIPQNSGFLRVIEHPRFLLWNLSTEEWVLSPESPPDPQIAPEPSVRAKPIVEVEDLRLPVTIIQFDAYGERILLAGFYGGEVRGGSEWELLCRVTPPVQYNSGWAISPDGRLVLVGTLKREVIVYDAETGAERERLNFNVGRVSQLAFAPDGLTAAACGGTKRIAIWDVE